jgi:Kdo2-lipid IVA lauroyltransferase/acyltransferase
VQAALDQTPKRGLLLLTPHMGAFDQAARSYAERFGHQQALTALYRPPRQRYLQGLMRESRQRPGMQVVPTDLSGVKAMLKALRGGGCVGLLPDQVPPNGMGEWVDFLGKPAYTMSLVARLIAQTQPTVLWLFAERLSWGRGFRVHVFESGMSQAEVAQSGNAALLARLNQELKDVVRTCPQQYLWGYNRYKQPAAQPADGKA